MINTGCITLKGIVDEDFVNYRVPSMTLMFPYCDFKCETEGNHFCQNASLTHEKNVAIEINKLCERYIRNPITEAVVCQGLEPFDSFAELLLFIVTLRGKFNCYDDIVIYTGYNKDEIGILIDMLADQKNIIVKFGRFIPNQEKHFDDVLGVMLASDNQYGEKIS